jgi:hypothetical protein
MRNGRGPDPRPPAPKAPPERVHRGTQRHGVARPRRAGSPRIPAWFQPSLRARWNAPAPLHRFKAETDPHPGHRQKIANLQRCSNAQPPGRRAPPVFSRRGLEPLEDFPGISSTRTGSLQRPSSNQEVKRGEPPSSCHFGSLRKSPDSAPFLLALSPKSGGDTCPPGDWQPCLPLSACGLLHRAPGRTDVAP